MAAEAYSGGPDYCCTVSIVDSSGQAEPWPGVDSPAEPNRVEVFLKIRDSALRLVPDTFEFNDYQMQNDRSDLLYPAWECAKKIQQGDCSEWFIAVYDGRRHLISRTGIEDSGLSYVPEIREVIIKDEYKDLL